ncbi:MAG: hydrolase, isochorismatase family [Acidobacteria bacterium]|nr:hydrolase, isochorismatase family [Acidobacteriota bacterium]
MPALDRHQELESNIDRLVRGTHLLGIPSLLTEQYVRGLGETVEPIRRAFAETSGFHPIEKSCFSSYGCAPFETRLRELERSQVLLAGAEAHVCVYQTAADLLEAGFEVHLVADAVSSRSPENKEIALRRLVSDGVRLTSTEMVLFELLVRSGTDEFRAISKLVK